MLNNSWSSQVLLFACTMASEQERLRLRVVQYYNTHRDEKKSMTVTHFASEGVSKRTIYHILQKYSGGESVRRRIGSGRETKNKCECGGTFLASNKSKHIKSVKHQTWSSNQRRLNSYLSAVDKSTNPVITN
jgi:hypothetical protein